MQKSINAKLLLDKPVYEVNEKIEVSFANGSTHINSWIGVYRQGQIPGIDDAIKWAYTGGLVNGSVNFELQNISQYYVAYFDNDDKRYIEIAPRVSFKIVDKDLIMYLDKQIYGFNDKITISYRNVQANVRNWIGVWRYEDGYGANRVGLDGRPWHQKNTNKPDIWTYLTQENGEHIIDADKLSPGRYAAFLLEKDAYNWLAQPVIFDIANQQRIIDLKVLSFNIWREGIFVTNGYEGIVNEILATNADVVAIAEAINANGPLTQRLVDSLNSKGKKYYSYKSKNIVGILSRYPIQSYEDFDNFTKAIIQVNDIEIAFYSAYLDYKNYAAILPRGYDGNSYEEIFPVTDTNSILAMNNASSRPNSIRAFIKDAENEINACRLVIVAGDFNEPSWLDWTYTTRNMYDHNGVIVPWTSTKLLDSAGYLDSYRVKYPDPVKYPGFTWVADNPDATVEKLAHAPKADERDRIDYIFYYPDKKISVKDSIIVGPSSSIVRSQRVEESGRDTFKIPESVYPSDHKAVLTIFNVDCTK